MKNEVLLVYYEKDKMVKINSDAVGILYIHLEMDPSRKTYKTVIIKSGDLVQLYIYKKLCRDVSNGDYLCFFEPSNQDYTIFVYTQDKPVDYSSVDGFDRSNFLIQKAINGFELKDLYHFANSCKICSSKQLDSITDNSGEMISTCQLCNSKVKIDNSVFMIHIEIMKVLESLEVMK